MFRELLSLPKYLLQLRSRNLVGIRTAPFPGRLAAMLRDVPAARAARGKLPINVVG